MEGEKQLALALQERPSGESFSFSPERRSEVTLCIYLSPGENRGMARDVNALQSFTRESHLEGNLPRGILKGCWEGRKTPSFVL
jgi:hypothetical protein